MDTNPSNGGIEFEENLPTSSLERTTNADGFVVRLIFKLGLAKTEKDANTVLIFIMCVCLLATTYIILNTTGVLSPRSSTQPVAHPPSPLVRERLNSRKQ